LDKSGMEDGVISPEVVQQQVAQEIQETDTIEAFGLNGDVNFESLKCDATERDALTDNNAGLTYPEVLNPGTGEQISYPGQNLMQVPVSDRVSWGAQDRATFIKEWYDNGYATSEGGWSEYDIHHVIPREYGGTNEFANLVPVERGIHQNEFNAWWRGYG
jgi:hypothetical protein